MAGPVDTSGPIETFCHKADAPSSRRSTLSFDDVTIGDRVALHFFAGGDGTPPFSLKIRAPTGAMVVDRILRDLPTGLPQSEPPIELVVSLRGNYAIEIREVRGNLWGKATLRVT